MALLNGYRSACSPCSEQNLSVIFFWFFSIWYTWVVSLSGLSPVSGRFDQFVQYDLFASRNLLESNKFVRLIKQTKKIAAYYPQWTMYMRSTATNKLPRNPFTILSRVFSRASPMEVLHEKTLHASGGAVRFCGDKFSNRQLKEHFKSQCGQFLPRLYRPVSLVIIKPVEPSIDKNSQVPLGKWSNT